MSDPVDLDTMAAKARVRIEEDGPHSPTPWQVCSVDVHCDAGDYIDYHVEDVNGQLVAVADSCIDAEMIVVARNILEPLLNDRDRLKAEVAALEGILSDLSSESYQVQRIRDLEQRVKVLEDALQPFAEWAGQVRFRGWNPADTDALGVVDGRPVWGVTVADLRRAAKVLEGRTP